MKNMDQATALVPFGKYKGQPVEVMQMDTAYCDWLSKQSWFREQYGNVYNQVIINNFTEPTETPEHNRLQAKFLDDDFVFRFVASKILPVFLKRNKLEKQSLLQNPEYKDRFSDIDVDPQIKIKKVEFEVNGWDVCVGINYREICNMPCHHGIMDGETQVLFEIKPCIGDDFPAILRQIKQNSKRTSAYGFKVCVVDQFTAVGATYEQVQKMFNLSGISLFMFSDFEE